ncbi:MAG: ABC transporter substrate-binding protein, partial [Dehalococcoidia bacterium]|nr:ABC transporter substrate-binding protein [Dehalococcoidia bacterium]
MAKLLNVRWMLGALVLIALAFGAACGDDEGEAEPEATAEASPAEGETPEAAAEIITFDDVLEKDPTITKTGELKWGSMFELSGAWAGFGEPTGDGVKLAVKEINEAGGVQIGDTIYTISLVEHDTRSEVTNTIATATELIQDEGVNVIWGPATLGEPEATVITQQNEVIHLCPCQERETTALQNVDQAHGESRWAFQTLLPFSLLIEQGARNFVEDYPDFDTFALLCVNNETSQDICGRTAEAYQAVGVELVGEEYFPVGTTDYSPFLTKLRSGDPDFLFNFDDPPNQANIIRQAIEAGVGRLHIASLPANLIEPLVGIPLTVPVTAGAAPRQHVKPTTQEAADYFDR